MKLKKLILSACACLCAALASWANVTHVVDRGETLKIIAQKYGVTEAQIIALNPDAAQFVYVGMELEIPVAEAPAATPQQPASTAWQTATATNSQPVTQSSAVEEERPWSVCMDIAYGFLSSDKQKVNGQRQSGNSYTYGITIGANYTFYKGAYAGARIGYNSSNYQSHATERGSYVNVTTAYHFIALPLEVGYKFGDKIALIPHLGFDLNMCVSSKSKVKSNFMDDKKNKPDKPFCTDFNLGLRVSLWGFTINGGYHVPLGDDTKKAFGKDGYFTVGLGFFM